MKPIIYRITHLWPNKQPGQGLTAQIEQDQERWTISVCAACGDGTVQGDPDYRHNWCTHEQGFEVEVVRAPDDSSTGQIKPETDGLNALPSRFVSLQDYEALEREARS